MRTQYVQQGLGAGGAGGVGASVWRTRHGLGRLQRHPLQRQPQVSRALAHQLPPLPRAPAVIGTAVMD